MLEIMISRLLINNSNGYGDDNLLFFCVCFNSKKTSYNIV